MLKVLYSRRGQNFMEYAMLVIVIVTALLAMRQYIQRSLNARLKQIQMELNESKR